MKLPLVVEKLLSKFFPPKAVGFVPASVYNHLMEVENSEFGHAPNYPLGPMYEWSNGRKRAI